MRDNNDRPAPDFTHACIVMFGVNIMWIFIVIWITWGMLAVALCGWGVKVFIDRIAQRRR